MSCVVLMAGGIGAAYWFANNKWDQVVVANIPSDTLAAPQKGKPSNYLIVAADTSAGDTSPAADAIMVAHLDPASGRVVLVSFSSELSVNVPGRGTKALGSAFSDGPAKVVETLKQNFEIPIHHYLEVDIASLRNLVNAIGTIPVYFAAPARDQESGLSIRLPGCYHFNGDDVVAYARSATYEYRDASSGKWKKDPNADLGMLLRQQYFMRSLARIAIDAAAEHPLRADGILDHGFATLRKDKGLGLSDVRALAAAFRSAEPASVRMLTVPTKRSKVPGQNLLLVDQAGAAAVFAPLRYFGPKPKPLPVPKDVVPKQVTVKVLNGTTAQGLAKATMAALQFTGFKKVDQPGNADRSDYNQTEVRYARGALHKAQLVAAYLGVGKLVAGASDPGVDVTVVLGSDFERVTVPTTAPPTTTTTAPKVFGTTTTTTLPGPSPGAKAQPVVGC